MNRIQDIYEHTRESVMTQNYEGKFVHRSPKKCYKILIAIGVMNLGIAISSFFTYSSLKTYTLPYNTDAQSTLVLPKGTSYLYIDLTGVYQNYLSYTKSISQKQLKGQTENLNLSDTKPFDFDGDKVYYPAGAIALSFFTDKISVLDKLGNNVLTETGITRKQSRKKIGITSYSPDEVQLPLNWSTSTNEGTKPLNLVEPVEGLPILNERFINWIDLASFSTFKKLWGKIELEDESEVNLFIESNYNLADDKKIYITQKSILGIPNYTGISIVLAIGVCSLLSGLYLNRYGY